MNQHGRTHLGPNRKPMCSCGAEGIRDEKFDAYYCPNSGTWLESKCSDPKCPFHCSERPEVRSIEP